MRIFFSAGALFSTAEIYVNDTLVSIAGSLYSYQAYMETLLNYSPETKQGWLTNELYYRDTPRAFNSITQSDKPYNEGMTLRREITHNSAP